MADTKTVVRSNPVFTVTLPGDLDSALRGLAAERRTPLSWLAADIFRGYLDGLRVTP